MLIYFRAVPLRAAVLILGLLTALVCTACQAKKELRLSGKTMGTTYHIKVVTGLFTSGADLQAQIDNRLAAINRSMSTYDPGSEISRFNGIDSASESFSPSDDFLNVLKVSAELYRAHRWGLGRYPGPVGQPMGVRTKRDGQPDTE
jgi:thiamine biosynthesis lipoprotein